MNYYYILTIGRSIVIIIFKTIDLTCGVTLHAVVSPSGKPSISPRCIPPEAAAAAGRFPIMSPADCLPGGYRRPPGPAFMMPPHGPGMPIPRHGAYVLPPDGRGTSDLQTFVNRVHPASHSFPHDPAGGPPAVMAEMHGQRFPAGQKPASYGSVEQFNTTPPYPLPRDQPIKVEHQPAGLAQPAGFANGSPPDQGSTMNALVQSIDVMCNGKIFPKLDAHRVALISISLALSETPL